MAQPIRGEWMKGRCWDMAVALHRLTNLPIYGLYDAHGDCHHAFVMTGDGQGIDARGIQAIEKLKAGCAGQEIRLMNMSDIDRWVGRELSVAEINAARRAIAASPLLQTSISHVIQMPITQTHNKNKGFR